MKILNFKEALIAHLQGERVEIWSQFFRYGGHKDQDLAWRPFGEFYEGAMLKNIEMMMQGSDGTPFRLAPRTIFVNCVEVPAPESVAPSNGSDYYLPKIGYSDCLHEDLAWTGHGFDFESLKRGIVYLNKEDAIARAKAMLITKEAE